MVSIASLLGARHLWEVVENKPASSLVVSLGKALNGMPAPLCGRQVAHKPRKRQLPSECGLPVQSIAIQFAFSWMEDKNGKTNNQTERATHHISAQLAVGMKPGNQDNPWAPYKVCKNCTKIPRKSESNKVRCAYGLARAPEPPWRIATFA